ncbi:MAG: hypothetical protein ABW098_10265 [Candidatus Thiodiazotropha sp.]
MNQACRNSINLVIALPAEAKPLITMLSLKRDQQNRLLPCYSANGIQLIVTGPGTTAVAKGVYYLHRLSPSSQVHWINIGICGHGSLAVGSPLLVEHIIDSQSGEQRSLSIPCQISSTIGSLTSVTKPQAEYEVDMAYDMESWGFIEAVTAIDSTCPATILKIVSDNPHNGVNKINGEFVRMLVQQHLDLIQSLIERSKSNHKCSPALP